MKKCSVYFRGGEIYILASARDVFGIDRNVEPFTRLGRQVAALELGRVILDAMAAYRENIPGKTYVRGVKEPPHPFLLFAGFKSWKAFEKGAGYFMISDTGSEIEITPGVPAEKGGYLHQPDKAVRCLAQPEAIGILLLQQVS
jgi:hypothetical protein